MAKSKSWWSDPTKITGTIIGIIVIAIYIGVVFKAYARQEAQLEAHDKAIEELDTELTEQEKDAKGYYVQQQLIQQDLGYLKESQKEILEAIKQKR